MYTVIPHEEGGCIFFFNIHHFYVETVATLCALMEATHGDGYM